MKCSKIGDFLFSDAFDKIFIENNAFTDVFDFNVFVCAVDGFKLGF